MMSIAPSRSAAAHAGAYHGDGCARRAAQARIPVDENVHVCNILAHMTCFASMRWSTRRAPDRPPCRAGHPTQGRFLRERTARAHTGPEKETHP